MEKRLRSFVDYLMSTGVFFPRRPIITRLCKNPFRLVGSIKISMFEHPGGV